MQQSKLNAIAFHISVLFLLIIIPNNSFAYIDPGTGSYIVQIIIAGILGGIFAVKLFWKQVKDFVLKIFKLKGKDESKH